MPNKLRTVVELGAGCALPSLLSATLTKGHPSLVIITDYPDETILSNLRSNVQENKRLIAEECKVICKGHEWGTDVDPLLYVLPFSAMFVTYQNYFGIQGHIAKYFTTCGRI